MLRKWSVNLRLELNGERLPKPLETTVYKVFSDCDYLNEKGFYWIMEHRGRKYLLFLGCQHPKFPMTWGWFPEVFPYDDPYQAIRRGMTLEDFERILKSLGFEQIEVSL